MNPIEELIMEHKAVSLTLRILDQIILGSKLDELSRGFDQIEAKKIGAGKHEAFHAMIEELEDIYLSEGRKNA